LILLDPQLAFVAPPVSVGWLDQMGFVNSAVGRLLLACLLGGLIGLERELAKKPAGVRTNLLICLGAAFFTILSSVIAGETGSNKGQIASTSSRASASSAQDSSSTTAAASAASPAPPASGLSPPSAWPAVRASTLLHPWLPSS